MKKRIFTVAFVLSALLCWPRSWSIENPGIGNPIGPSTIPPSTFSSGLVSTPSPIDTSGNLLITGNVRRGRHFRGDVPYRSPTSFGSSLGSSSLSSFLRDTAGSEDFQTYSNNYGTQPYYSPTETVTTMIPGRSEVFSPANTRMNTRVAETDVPGLEFQPNEQALFGQVVATADSDLQRPVTQYGPLAQSRLMLESKFPTDMSLKQGGAGQIRQAQIGIHPQDETSAVELYKKQVQDIRGRTQSTEQPPNQMLDGNRKQTTYTHQGISALEQYKPSDTASQKNLISQKSTNWSAISRELQTDREQVSKSGAEQGEVLERIRQQLEDLTKSLDTVVQSQGLRREASSGLTEKYNGYLSVSNDPAVKQEQMPMGYQQYVPNPNQIVPRERINSGGTLNSYKQQGGGLSFEREEPGQNSVDGFGRTNNSNQTALEFTGISNYTTSQKRSSPLEELNKRSQADISAEADRIMGLHTSIESLSESKFNHYMRDAEEQLMAGGYYHAASSYSLALIYQADNPLALAGRGHALLAAGEYVSSALFLSRALEVSPEYLRMKIDLVAMLGGENKLQVRIADIEQWLARSGSSQLQFLLGYIYYRTGQLLKAKQVIDAAYEKTPESPAVQVVKIAIDNITARK